MRTSRAGMIFLATVLLAVAGCASGTSAAGPTPEPRMAIVQALQSTAKLHAVHALLRIELREADGRQFLATFEGDVDIAARELDVTAAFVPGVFGTERARAVLVDGFLFYRSDGSWSTSGGPGSDPLAGVPATAEVAAAVEDAIRNPATSITLAGTEACGDATCLRVRAEVPAQVAWHAMVAMLQAAGQPQGSAPSMPNRFPGVAIDFWIEPGTLRLRQATNTTMIDGHSVSIVLSRHDVPVAIRAPVQR